MEDNSQGLGIKIVGPNEEKQSVSAPIPKVVFGISIFCLLSQLILLLLEYFNVSVFVY